MKTNKGSSSAFIFIIVGIIGLVILTYYLVSTKSVPSFDDYVQQNSSKLSTISVGAPNGTINTFVATSSDDQELGLGGRDSISKQEGMIFAFPDSASRGFWMQDMLFPIDIVWIREDKTVASVTSGIATSTYPDIFFPTEPVMYVLELNAGSAKDFGIATGTPLQFVI
ncbi:MAG: DUF192 domain-containing protein [Candidatus Paceibacterota bacterium]